MEKRAPQTAMRLTNKGKAILDALADKYGVNRTAVVEMALREKAEKDQVYVTDEVKSNGS